MKLDAAARKAIPASKFGMPGSRKYPMPDASHAANAKARATQQVEAGNLSASQAATIRSKANKMLAKAVVLFAVLGVAAHAHAAVKTLQVTLGSGNTSILSAGAHLNTRWFTIQNNAAHTVRIGDTNISTTRGILLQAGPAGGSFYVAPDPAGSGRDLGGWFINGTSGDVIDVIYDDGQ